MEKKTIGKFIAVLRKANGLTQADLAEKLFVSADAKAAADVSIPMKAIS